MRRIAVRVAIGLASLLVVVILAGLPVYVFPVVADSPREVDVILVLGGRQDGREQYAISLAQSLMDHGGHAPTVLVSDPYRRPDDYMDAVCGVPRDVRVVCFDPQPRTTRGEAQFLTEQARRFRWRSAMVVTFTPHVTRADYIVSRCFPGEVVMIDYRVGLSPVYWAWMYVYQSAGFVRAFTQDGC